MSNKNKDKETGKRQPKAVAPASETPATNPDNAPGAEIDAQVNAGKTEPENPAGDAAKGAVPETAEKVADIKETTEPKVSDAVAKIGKTLLKSNPAMSVVFMTSDGRGFYEKNDADNHARTLKNKAVTPVKK